ncbi:MAG TPA: hypothetical protein VK660_02010 [Xanthomonadaceae bacterium]|jgi:hypothetical protein|nr:hypothetical protein [Xanthomonadaceae bacterium]
MSTQIKAQPMNRDRRPARDVLLAGIGAVSLLRKNAGKSWSEATAIAGRIPEASSVLMEGIGERSNAFRHEFIRLAGEVGRQASVARTNLASDVESRLQPLLRKLGIKPTKAKRKVVAKRGKSARKPAAKRVARKPRKAA